MPKTISFTGGSDFDFEANDIARKRAMAEALLAKSQQGMPGTQMVSGIALRNSPLQGLAQLLQGYGANKQMEDLSRRERELGASKRADMAKAFESYNAMRQGGTSFAPPEGAEMGPVEAPGAFTQKKADPRGAAMAAILSGHQPLQQIGMMDLQNANKGLDPRVALEMAKTFTNDSIVAHNAGTGQLVRKPKISVTPGGVVAADPETGALLKREDLSMDERHRYDAAAKELNLRMKAGEFAYNTGREAPPINLPKSYTGAPQAAAGAMPMPQAAPAAPMPRAAMQQSVSPEARATQVAILRDELATAKDEATAIRTIRELNALGVKEPLSSPTFPKNVGEAPIVGAPAAQGALPTKLGDAMALAKEKARLASEAAKAKDAAKPLDSIEKKELLEANDSIAASKNTITSLGRALALNKEAMGFAGAGAVSSIGTVLPKFARPESIDKTRELDNIVKTTVLPNLKQIFGGNPTNAEREVMMQISGTSNELPGVREGIFNRAIELANAKIKRDELKIKQIQSGKLFEKTGRDVPSASGGAFDFSEIDRMTGFKK